MTIIRLRIQHKVSSPSSAEWHEEIVPDPRGQGYMPPLPEVGRISGQERPRKIKWKLKAQQLGATASDIGVTREIEKDLHEESDATGPCGQPARVRRRIS